MKWFLVTAFLVVLCPRLTRAADPLPVEFAFSDFQHKNDVVKVESAEGKVLLRITSNGGIGYVTARAKKGAWPERVTLLLEKFEELEDFELKIGRVNIEGNRKASGSFDLYYFGKDMEFRNRSRIGTVDVKVERRKDGIAITFPAKLFIDAEEVTIRWIDWLRV